MYKQFVFQKITVNSPIVVLVTTKNSIRRWARPHICLLAKFTNRLPIPSQQNETALFYLFYSCIHFDIFYLGERLYLNLQQWH